MPINKKYLLTCILLSLMLCYAQILASRVLILACLGVYLTLLGWACTRHMTLPLLLFFLPWATIMKLSPGSYSFYTFGLVLSCGISVFRGHLRIKKYALLSGIAILTVALFSKLLDGTGIAYSFIAFLMMLMVLPAVKQESGMGTYDFYNLTLFYGIGIILAALCAREYAEAPNIARFIQVEAYNVIIRRSGFYGDANFYTAQITAAIGGCMMLLLRERQRSRTVLMMALTFMLVYCGAMSGSKSFVIITACMTVVWLGNLLRMRNRPGLKTILIVALLVFAVVLATSEMFSDLVEVIVVRFSRSDNLNSFTTNRLSIWQNYFKELFGNIKVFFVGRGYTDIKVAGKASHNTILQMFHQFGILGAPFLMYWVSCFLRDAPSGWRGKGETRRFALVVVMGVYMPWMALDALFFDDFFLLQWYAFMALYQTPQPQKKNLPRYPVPPVTKPTDRTLRNTIHQ